MRLSLAFVLAASFAAAAAADQYKWTVTTPDYDSLHYSLEGHSFETVNKIYLESLCAQMCIKDSRCSSFNIHHEGSKCVLNDQSDEGYPQDLKPKNGSRYYRRSDFVVDGDALGLCKRNPCKNNGRCIETCDGKGGRLYECLCVDSNWQGEHCEEKAEAPEFSAWDDWGVCSVSCGEGVKVRRRHCKDPTTGNVRNAMDCYGNDIEFQHCDGGVCPFFSPWSIWSHCDASKKCGSGSKSRTRSCQNGGKVDEDRRCTGPTEELSWCSAFSCQSPIRLEGDTYGKGQLQIFNEAKQEFEAVCGRGLDQKVGDVACRQLGFDGAFKVASGGSSSKSYIITDVKCSGDEASIVGCQHTDTETTDACAAGPAQITCVVDGGWGTWSDWGTCSVTCENGTQTRVRTCTYPSQQNGGRDCQGADTENRGCTERPCPVDGFNSEWSEWKVCNKACGGGIQRKTRTCTPPKNGGSECEKPDFATQLCNIEPCPGPQWSEWSEWGECSVECGGGRASRDRSCTKPKNAAKEDDCAGDAKETRECGTTKCPVDGVWKKWGEWSECSVECGGGDQERRRECDGPMNGGEDCEGSPKEIKTCNPGKCPIDGVPTKWLEWGECDEVCGGGKSERTRTCDGPHNGGQDCKEPMSESRTCNIFKCPIDGIWAEWGAWTGCSKTCASGESTRTRACTGPFYGGDGCGEKREEKKTCNPSPCPIDGVWSQWGDFGECSVKCGGGERERLRVCSGAKNGGQDCEGIPKETEDCNTSPCPIDGVWGDWTEWQTCECDDGNEGTQSKTRNCSGPLNGGEDCTGIRQKEQDCKCS